MSHRRKGIRLFKTTRKDKKGITHMVAVGLNVEPIIGIGFVPSWQRKDNIAVYYTDMYFLFIRICWIHAKGPTKGHRD